MSGGEGTWLQVSNSETHPRELEAALSGPRVSLCLTASSALTVLLKAPSANSDGEEFDIFFLPSRELSGCLVRPATIEEQDPEPGRSFYPKHGFLLYHPFGGPGTRQHSWEGRRLLAEV